MEWLKRVFGGKPQSQPEKKQVVQPVRPKINVSALQQAMYPEMGRQTQEQAYKAQKMKETYANFKAGKINRNQYETISRGITQGTFNDLGRTLQEMTPNTAFDLQDKSLRGLAKTAVEPVRQTGANVYNRLAIAAGRDEELRKQQMRQIDALSTNTARAQRAFKAGKINSAQLAAAMNELEAARQGIENTRNQYRMAADPKAAAADIVNVYLMGKIPAKGFQAGIAGTTRRGLVGAAESGAKQGFIGGAVNELYKEDPRLLGALQSGAQGALTGGVLSAGAYGAGKTVKLARSPAARQEVLQATKKAADVVNDNVNAGRVKANLDMEMTVLRDMNSSMDYAVRTGDTKTARIIGQQRIEQIKKVEALKKKYDRLSSGGLSMRAVDDNGEPVSPIRKGSQPEKTASSQANDSLEVLRQKMEAAFKEVNDEAATKGTVNGKKWREANALADAYNKATKEATPPVGKTVKTEQSKPRNQRQAVSPESGRISEQLPNPSPKQGNASQVAATGSVTRTAPESQAASRVGTPSVRTRGFIETVMNDPNTSPKIRDSISSIYNVRNTKQLQTRAANLVKADSDLAYRIAKSGDGDVSVAVGSELVKKLQTAGDYERAIEVTETLAEQLTKAGQTAQAASIYGRLTPEGALRFAQRELDKYNQYTRSSLKLTAEKAKAITEKAKKLEGMPEGYEKQVATQQLLQEIYTAVPATLPEKISTLQTMAQLLNPKTNIRNILGNTMFGGLENISQTVSTPLDKLLSLVTGRRTTGLPSLKTQAVSGVKGGKTAVKEAFGGINTGAKTQFDLNDVPVFRKGILGTLEKTMNATLRGADRAAYEASFDDAIRAQMKATKTNVVTPEMIEAAHHTGLYRTFQDENAISNFFVGMKRSLNKIGVGTEGKRFGLGDIVLKYPKTPANLLARGIDYSPAGFVRSIFEASKPLFGKEFDQRAFVDSFGRAVTGSGTAFGTGYILAANGIITAQPEENKDLRNTQRAEGLGGYQINVSAFKRWVAGGFNKDAGKLREGDTLVSYDWAQPAAIPLSAGAALGARKPQKAGSSPKNAVANSLNTLVEQPLLQGVQRLFGGYGGITDSAVETAKGVPASFTPTILNQAGQLIDNTPRNTTDPNPFTEAANKVIARIPIASTTLPEQVDVLGDTRERYQDGGNNPLNVLFNPAFVNRYKPSKATSTANELYNTTGETKQLPPTVPTTVKINGENKKLTGKEQADYQRFVGSGNTKANDLLNNDSRFNALSNGQRVNVIANLQTDISAAGRIKLFGDKPDKVSESVDSILTGNLERAVELKLKNAEKANKPKTEAKPTSKTKAKVARLKTKKSGGSRKSGVRIGRIRKPQAAKLPSIRAPRAKRPKYVKLRSSRQRKIRLSA